MGERGRNEEASMIPSPEEEKEPRAERALYLMALQLETVSVSPQALLTQTVLDKRHPTHRTVAKLLSEAGSSQNNLQTRWGNGKFESRANQGRH